MHYDIANVDFIYTSCFN